MNSLVPSLLVTYLLISQLLPYIRLNLPPLSMATFPSTGRSISASTAALFVHLKAFLCPHSTISWSQLQQRQTG
jgi:hypothetical protein